MRWGMVIDLARCIGCYGCAVACKAENGTPPGIFFRRVLWHEEGRYPTARRVPMPASCNHCADAPCVSVCPSGASHQTAEGVVLVDDSQCIGCRYCMMACPFGVPTYEWHSAAPRVRKCQMCVHRGAAGPACAEACPAGATITGDRDELIAEARRRVASDPKTYFQRVYGITEAGGTDVLYIGPREPAALGLPAVKTVGPLPELTWNALRHIPDVVLFGGVFLGGLFWLTKRKEDVARAELAELADKGDHHA